MSLRELSFLVPSAWPERREGTWSSRLRRDGEGCRAALIGLPDDLGVRLNGGRPGAAQGPSAVRAVLARFGMAFDGACGRELRSKIFDAGDVLPAPGEDEAALFATHQRVEQVVRACQDAGMVTICLGGGHDLTLPAVRAASRTAQQPLGGINVDAHLDVRQRVGSGMPFRRLIEEACVDPRRFSALGIGRFTSSESDLYWLQQTGAQVHFEGPGLDAAALAGPLLTRATQGGPAFLSVDLDVLSQASAPGVSAPAPLGLGPREVAPLVAAAGRCPEIRHLDLMELCPAHDVGGATARVAAAFVLEFVAGMEERP